jgi:ABC-type uncharacterized transport system substrate-binding protein
MESTIAHSYMTRFIGGAIHFPSNARVLANKLLINLKTAKELNIAIPPGVLGMADEVIE